MKRSKSVHTDTYVLTSCRLLRFIRLKGVRMDGLRVACFASYGRPLVVRGIEEIGGIGEIWGNHYSIIPSFNYSITQSLHYSITPSFYHLYPYNQRASVWIPLYPLIPLYHYTFMPLYPYTN